VYNKQNSTICNEWQAKLEELEKECIETNGNMERLQRSYAELVEMQLVLEKAGNFFDSRTTASLSRGTDSALADGEAPLLEAPVSSLTKLILLSYPHCQL
jgi:V-type H+-transporting ATPase subunit a